MAKVAIKNENITSYGGIYYIMDVFSKLGFEKLTESVLGKNVEVAAKHSVMEVFFVVFHTSPLVWWGILCLDKSKKHQKASYQCIESQKTSQYIKFSHKKKCCGIKGISNKVFIFII